MNGKLICVAATIARNLPVYLFITSVNGIRSVIEVRKIAASVKYLQEPSISFKAPLWLLDLLTRESHRLIVLRMCILGRECDQMCWHA